MTTFYTSDHHFGHANILKYEDAPRRNIHGGCFQSIDHMDTYLVDQWNATVSPSDTVYHLGDLAFKYAIIETILPFLNGTISLITGNHDPMFKQMLGTPEQQANARYRALEAGFADVFMQHAITIPGIGLTKLSHFPYTPPPDVPEHDQRYLHLRPTPTGEVALLHGHVHSQWLYKQDPGKPPMINLGVEVWGMRPVAEHELVTLFQNKGIAS
jgi:calcineurin-like phosphoesterase family protein